MALTDVEVEKAELDGRKELFAWPPGTGGFRSNAQLSEKYTVQGLYQFSVESPHAPAHFALALPCQGVLGTLSDARLAFRVEAGEGVPEKTFRALLLRLETYDSR